MNLPSLTDSERAIVRLLTESYSSSSAVRVAADLYQRGINANFDSGDCVGYVCWVLEHLADKGIVTYRESHGRHDLNAPPGYIGLPYNIRLTRIGWEIAGYPHIHAEVGRESRHHREVRPDDSTDYRTHHEWANGGPIERLPWWEHRSAYPDHEFHDYPIDYTFEDHLTMTNKTPYLRVTPEIEERVMTAYARLGNYEKTAQETNVTPRQVRYIVTDRPVMGRSSGSLKMRTLRMITERGPYPDMTSLHDDLPGPHGLHNLVHVLHSLHKAQLIDFREDTRGNNTNYLNIRARKEGVSDMQPVTDNGATNGVAPTVEVDQTIAEPTTVEVEATPEPLAVTFIYPELERIKALRDEYQRREGKSSQYMAAAEILAESDPETAELLLNKAAEIAVTRLSPVESEYLLYVEAHPNGNV